MGLDGFSMANLGLHKNSTSAQMANQSEQLTTKGLEFKIKDVTGAGKQKGVARKEEDSKNSNNETFKDQFLEEEDEELQSIQSKINEKLIEKSFEEKNPQDFAVRINPSTGMVELFNSQNKKIIETIDANDLMDLVAKLDSASGILVNKKV